MSTSPSTDRPHGPAPIAPPPRKLIFPEYRTVRLANNCRLILVEDHTQTLVSLSVVIKNGALHEPIAGLASFTAKMLKKGTATRSAQTIAAEIDFLGGTLRVGVDWDATNISLNVLSEFLDQGLDLMADVLLNPAFNTDEIERMQRQSIAGLQQQEVDPAYLSSRALSHGLYAGHPYGHPAMGTQATIASIRSEDCRAWYEAAFASGQAFFVAAGDVDESMISDMLNARFGGWNNAGTAFAAPNAPAKLNGRSVLIAPKKDAVQASVRVGLRAPMHDNRDYVPIQVCNTLFGAMFVSRLSSKIREEKGYTYGIDSYIDARRHASAIIIGSNFGNAVTTPAMHDLFAELERMRREAISAEELDLTRNYLLGSFALRFETPQQIVGLISILELYDLPADYYQNFFERITALDADQLLEVQGRWFDEENLVIGVCGDEAQVRVALGEFGESRVIDVNKVDV